jgi:hypothetical protein
MGNSDGRGDLAPTFAFFARGLRDDPVIEVASVERFLGSASLEYFLKILVFSGSVCYPESRIKSVEHTEN